MIMIDEKELISKLEQLQDSFEDYKIKKRCDRLKVHEVELFIYFIEKLKKVIESMPKAGETK